jgi:hypothetical protein
VLFLYPKGGYKLSRIFKNGKPHLLTVSLKHFDAKGNLLWEQGPTDNILHDEGEQAILSAYFATAKSGYGAPPANLYLGVDARSALAEADTLASLSNEPSGNNYARIALSTAGTGLAGQDFVISQLSAYYQAACKTCTFTCTGAAWGAVTKTFLCTVSSGTVGKLIASVALQDTRTLQVGDTLNVSIIVGQSE